jgi:hypothetical protein
VCQKLARDVVPLRSFPADDLQRSDDAPSITLAITWPQVVKAEVFCLAEAAQVNGGVREWQECQVQQEVTTAQSPSP